MNTDVACVFKRQIAMQIHMYMMCVCLCEENYFFAESTQSPNVPFLCTLYSVSSSSVDGQRHRDRVKEGAHTFANNKCHCQPVSARIIRIVSLLCISRKTVPLSHGRQYSKFKCTYN